MSNDLTPNHDQFLMYQTETGHITLGVRFEGELVPAATHKKFLLVRTEGTREVKRLLDYYILDMIIKETPSGLDMLESVEKVIVKKLPRKKP